jgi:hypothetical protein
MISKKIKNKSDGLLYPNQKLAIKILDELLPEAEKADLLLEKSLKYLIEYQDAIEKLSGARDKELKTLLKNIQKYIEETDITKREMKIVDEFLETKKAKKTLESIKKQKGIK